MAYSTNIPDWAIDRAERLHDIQKAQKWSHPWLRALAIHIAEHEEAPSDPDLELARKVLRDHGYDKTGTAEEALVRDAIKRVRADV